MSDAQIGYKIVYRRGERLFSYLDGLYPDNTLSIEYIPNVETMPNINGTPLFLFDNFNEADEYCNRYGNCNLNLGQHEVWKCKYVPHPQPVKFIIQGISGINDKQIEAFWAEKPTKVAILIEMMEPKGIQALSITLLEKAVAND